MRKKQKKQKKRLDPYAPYGSLYWYEKDNFVPPESMVTLADVERWKNAVAERYPFFDLIVKFRHRLDRDRNILPDTTEMAFWLTWKNRPENPEDVEYEIFEECLEQWLDNCFGYGFNRYLEPRQYSMNDECLSWHSLLDFVAPEKDPSDSGRDNPNPDEDGWLRINPITEMFEDYPQSRCHFNDFASLLNNYLAEND